MYETSVAELPFGWSWQKKGSHAEMRMASDLVAMTFAAGQSQDDSDTHKDGVFVDRFDTTRTSFSWQNDISVSLQNLVTVGVDLLQDKVNSTTSYAVNSRDNLGLFAQYLGNVSAASFQAALRYDDNEQFGGQITENG